MFKHFRDKFTELFDDHRHVDEHLEVPSTALVPFQVAYAVSIHKAQGLEFNSVKVVITDVHAHMLMYFEKNPCFKIMNSDYSTVFRIGETGIM